jgi:hypothetical protein
MNKFGTSLGILALIGIVAGFTFAPSSCSSLTPDQQARLQAIAVPAAGILSEVAVRKGYIEPGDKITLQRGIAIVTSADDAETKLFNLAELGIQDALANGLVSEGDTITVKSEDVVTILTPPTEGPLPIPFGDLIGDPEIKPDGPLSPLLPPP